MKSPALLLVDVGNTRVKWAVASATKLPVVKGDSATSEITSARIRKLKAAFPGHTVILSSVVPKLIPLFRKTFKRDLHLVTSQLPALGLLFNYPKPSEIGADRLAAAVAVHADGVWPVIVISCGTATAFSVVDAKGRFCGGVIAPGLYTQLAALLGATSQLPDTDLHLPKSPLGRSTQDAIRAGVMLNFQGGVNEITRALSATLKTRSPRIVLTGGNAKHLAKSLTLPHLLRPLLVFEGLRIIGNRILNQA